MKSRKIKRILVIVTAVLILLLAWLNTYGIKRTIDKTITADVYVDDDLLADAVTNITISGNLIRGDGFCKCPLKLSYLHLDSKNFHLIRF